MVQPLPRAFPGNKSSATRGWGKVDNWQWGKNPRHWSSPQTWELRQSRRIQHRINSAGAKRETYFWIGSDEKLRSDFEAVQSQLRVSRQNWHSGQENLLSGGWGHCLVHWRMFSSGQPWPLPTRCQYQCLVGQAKNVSRRCEMSPSEANLTPVWEPHPDKKASYSIIESYLFKCITNDKYTMAWK